MRVLVVPGTGIQPQHGGQGSFCRYLAEGLVEIGHSVEIAGEDGWTEFCKKSAIALRRPEEALGRKDDIDLVHVNGPGIRQAIQGLLRGYKVFLTHQDHRYICPATTAWTPRGCPENASCGPCAYCPNRGLQSRVHLRMLRMVAARCWNVAVSSYLLGRLALRNGHAILSPIRTEDGSTTQQHGLVGFAGRLVPEKGVEILLRAISKLPDVRLEIAGEGPLLPRLRELSLELGIAPHVNFLGYQSADKVKELYRRSSVICIPSVWQEPYGYAAAEALALGRGLIVSDRGALPELVGTDRGWICRAEDPDHWATTIARALADEEDRKRRVLNATCFVNAELSPLRVAQRYAKLYESALRE